MKFKYIFIVLILACSSLFTLSLEEQAEKDLELIIPEILTRVNEGKALAVLPFDGDPDKLWHNIVLNKLNESADFTLIDLENLDKLAKQNFLQQDPLFKQNTKKLGEFIPADLLVIGKVIQQNDIKTFLKRNNSLKLYLKLDEVDSGRNIWSESLLIQSRTEFDWRVFIIVTVIFYLFFRFLNFVTKGYKTKLFFVLWILTIAIWATWYSL